MKKIKTTTPLTTLEGKILKTSNDDSSDFTLGKAISNILISRPNKLGALKSWVLAKRFAYEYEVQLDDADFQDVREIVAQDQGFNYLVLGQCLELLNLKGE